MRRFRFDGVLYEVPEAVTQQDSCVKLPDGRWLKVGDWYKVDYGFDYSPILLPDTIEIASEHDIRILMEFDATVVAL